ncbi:MAG: substrate-binding domain-containing protein, partial [Sciscionella sp.]
MNKKRYGAVLGVLAAGSLALTACGTDNNSAASGTSASAAASSITCAKGSLTLAGSTAQTNAMSQWIKNYQTNCGGANINYGGGGSGAGVQQFADNTIDFAGSDFPLTKAADIKKANARCKAGPVIDLSMVPGPIAIGYNVPGVSQLNLSADVLAKIFTGKITKWNDPAI